MIFIFFSVKAKDLHNLQGGSCPQRDGGFHGILLWFEIGERVLLSLNEVQGAANKAEEPVGNMGIALGGLNRGMSEEGLDHSDVVTTF